MKKKILFITALSAVVAMGGIAGVSFLAHQGDEAKKGDSLLGDKVGADNAPGLALANGEGVSSGVDDSASADPSLPLASKTLGVKVTNAKEDGTRDLSFVAPLQSYKTLASAKFTRVLKNEDGSDLKASAEFEITTVYTTAVGYSYGADVALDASYRYFAIYTMTGIPADYDFATLSVSFAATGFDGAVYASDSLSANIQGVLGDHSKRVKYVVTDADKKEYGVQATDTNITEAVVEKYVFDVSGFVATKKGLVTNLLMKDSNNGAFDSCSNLVSIALPDSIASFTKYGFYHCDKLMSMTFPSALTNIDSSSVFSSNAWKTLNYNAIALVNSSDLISWDLDKVIISKDVVSLPDNLIDSTHTVGEVDYGGTFAEWQVLEGSKANGLNIDNVICSDTVKVTVTYHFAGASLTVGDIANQDSYVQSVVSGKAPKDPGKPVLAGKLFKGWFVDDAFTSAFDFGTVVTANIDVYAKFEDYPAGASIDAPIALDVGYSQTNLALTSDVPAYYFSFTSSVKDTYYFAVSNVELNGETTYEDPLVKIYDSTKTAQDLSYYSPTSTDKIFGDNNKYIAVAMEANETYYFSVAKENAFSAATDVFTVDVSFLTKEADTYDTAMDYVFGDVQKTTFAVENDHVFYKFVASESKDMLFKATSVGSYYYDFALMTLNEGKLTQIADIHNTSDSASAVSLVKGTLYYVYCTSNTVTSESSYASFTFGEMPIGSSTTNPDSVTLGADAITVSPIGGVQYHYYRLAITDEATYRVILSGGSVDYQKTVAILDATGSTTIASANEAGVSSSDGWGGTETDYGTTFELDHALSAGTYLIKVGFSRANVNYGFKFQVIKAEAGDFRSNAIAIDIGSVATLGGRPAGRYYSFVATASDYHIFALSGQTGSVTMKLYSDMTSSSSMSNGIASLTEELTAGSTYYLFVSDTVEEDLSLAVTHADTVEDGKTKATAFDIAVGVNDFDYAYSDTVDSCWYKLTVTTAGTYKIYSNNADSKDFKINGVYKGVEGTVVENSSNDDDNNAHGETQYKWDFYVEVALEAGDYYLSIKVPSGTYSAKIGIVLIA